MGALPSRAGGQALPPGLRPRAARALPHGRPGRQRDGLDLPRHRSRRGGHGRAAARHRQARRLHRRTGGHRPDRRRSPAGRDPAGLLPHPPRDRGPAGLPGADRAGAAAHRPQPPRLARARQPRRPVHARGVARAHDRQPGRQARLVRSSREGARARARRGPGSIAASAPAPTSGRSPPSPSSAPPDRSGRPSRRPSRPIKRRSVGPNTRWPASAPCPRDRTPWVQGRRPGAPSSCVHHASARMQTGR